VRQIAAYLSLIVMLFGMIVLIGGLCALVTNSRFFESPLLLFGFAALVVGGVVRWRTASGESGRL